MKIRAGTFIEPPPPEWQVAGSTTIDFDLPPVLVQHLRWLAERWALSLSGIVSDILVIETFGRHRLDQLVEHGVEPRQAASPADGETAADHPISIQVLQACADKLRIMAEMEGITPAHLCARLVRHHLLGHANPLHIEANATNPEGMNWRKDDAFVSLWMPQSLVNKVRDLSLLHSLTLSDVLRNTLLLRVYGRIRYEQWTSEGHWRPKRKSRQQDARGFEEGSIRFSPQRNVITAQAEASSPRPEFIKEHGKSTEATKVFLPTLLKQSLTQLAEARKQPVSEYCRHLLIAAI